MLCKKGSKPRVLSILAQMNYLDTDIRVLLLL